MNLRSLQWQFLRSVQNSHSMKDLYRDWVATGLLKKGKSKGGLADAMGIHQSQITRLLDGERQLKLEEVPIIAAYLESQPPGTPVFEPEAPDERPASIMVPIIGYVGAGAQTYTYAVPAGQLDEIEAPEGATESTVAVEIKGDSLGALFDRWIVFYDDVRMPVTSDLVGKLCVIGLADERILIKKIRRTRSGLFDLLSNTEDPITDASIVWAARVKQMVPR